LVIANNYRLSSISVDTIFSDVSVSSVSSKPEYGRTSNNKSNAYVSTSTIMKSGIDGTLRDRRKNKSHLLALALSIVALFATTSGRLLAATAPPTVERVFEWTVESTKSYKDPFNDVEVDVVFSRDNRSWRVPTFWRGGQKWSVRFAPPDPGEYSYHLESTDKHNPDLNGHNGSVAITAYRGDSELLQHGVLKVSANRRYFEHVDGKPFYWLGDTWWSGLSGRFTWNDFQTLTKDRNQKGFTVVQIVAGLVPGEEEDLSDLGFRNEGGGVWEKEFRRINPAYFDYADKRIQHLLENGIVPAIVGSWSTILRDMGVVKMKQHWRYVVARYGAYPVFWVLGGEVYDPPVEVVQQLPESLRSWVTPGWTEVARYLRNMDPYHHPLTVHERPTPMDIPLQDDSLTDFDLLQSSHLGVASLANSVAVLNIRYARSRVIKPVVQGEIGYEKLGEDHLENFQRMAFWLSMLNGAAGHTYGANGVWVAHEGTRQLHRVRFSFVSWQEGMQFPGGIQVGLDSRLLRRYEWWRFVPHPEWVAPRGTTLLGSRLKRTGTELGSWDLFRDVQTVQDYVTLRQTIYPAGEWKDRGGSVNSPYAAGIPGLTRFIYVPSGGVLPATPPTVLGLETGTSYHTYLWEPSTGTKVDLGLVERPLQGKVVFSDALDKRDKSKSLMKRSWDRGEIEERRSQFEEGSFTLLRGVNEANVVAELVVPAAKSAKVVLRFHDEGNYVATVYSPEDRSLYLTERRNSVSSKPLGKISLMATTAASVRIRFEVRDNKGAASLVDTERAQTTAIVDLTNTSAGAAGVLGLSKKSEPAFGRFELRESPRLVRDGTLERKLCDAQGQLRGELSGPVWDAFGRDKHILLDAYRPERLPTSGDWVLVLEARGSHPKSESGVHSDSGC
jgi:hypothetical protein